MIYSIGHKSPDLDSVAAAIALADLKNKIEGKNGNGYKQESGVIKKAATMDSLS